MRTIVEKQVNESILGSTNTGKKPQVIQFLQDNNVYLGGESKIDDDGNVIAKCFKMYNKKCGNINFKIELNDVFDIDSCDIEEICLPVKSKKIYVKDCKILKRIKVLENSVCDEVYFINCQALEDITSLKNMQFTKKIYFESCGCTSCDCAHETAKRIFFDGCENLKDVIGTFGYSTQISFDGCPVKNIEIEGGESLEIKYSKRLTDCTFTNKNLSTIHISNCRKLKNVNIDGNKLESFVLSSCNQATYVKCPDCTFSLSLIDLPAFEKLDVEKISGTAVFSKLPVIPEIQAKKIITRS